MQYDLVVRGGVLVDGLNVPRRRADVAVKNGVIAAIGDIPVSDATEVLDASGMIVAPGFIDLHTHYDAQLFWDPWCSLSGWHGVTSVAIGNCGFGFAPARAESQEYLMRSLTRVEAIPYAAIKASLPWSWESFPEWLDAVEAQPKGMNMMAYVPLNPLLTYVMGYEAAKSRDATESERSQMAQLLEEAIEAGACGWSAQRTPPGSGADMQRDYDGTPFSTDLMSNATALNLATVLSRYEGTFIQTVLKTGDPDGDLAHIEELAEASSAPILYNTVNTDSRFPDRHRLLLKWIRSCQERALPIYAQCLTTDAGFSFTFEDWNLWDESPAWREATLGTVAERLSKLGDPARRAALKEQPPTAFPMERLVVLRPRSEKFQPARGLLLADAARIMGYADQVDLLLDMIVEDELTTLFQAPQLNDDLDLQAEVVRAPYGIWGGSDGGAHTKFITSGAYPTESIINFVRERGLVTLEEAHYRLSYLPARCAGFNGRGSIVEGAPADIVVYDYENLSLRDEEVAYDLPGGEWRRIRKADGYRWIIVNGQVTFVDGEPTGTLPGQLLRRESVHV